MCRLRGAYARRGWARSMCVLPGLLLARHGVLTDLKERYNHAEHRASELTEHNTSMKLNMEADFNKRLELEQALVLAKAEKARIVKEQKEKHQREVEKMKKDFKEEVEKHKSVVGNLQKELR